MRVALRAGMPPALEAQAATRSLAALLGPGVGGAAAAPGAALVLTPDGDSARVAPWLGPSPPGLVARTAAAPSEPIDDELAALSAEAAASPFSPPATERHAAFLKLVDSALKAGLQKREQRCADFSALAAEAGVPLFGDDSVVVGRLRVKQAQALGHQGVAEAMRGPAGAAEATLLHRRSCRQEEEAYFVYEQQLIRRLVQQPVPSAAQLKHAASGVGYTAALDAAFTALNLLPLHSWRADQRGRAQAFVLAVVGLIPQTAGLLVAFVQTENGLISIIENNSNPSDYDPDFWALLQALWRSPAVADVLRSRGVLQGGIAAAAATSAEFKARQAADVAKRGLRVCALPSCGKQETTVLQFRVCGHCQRVRYCCGEHAKQHWPAHKRESDEMRSGSR